MSSGAPSEGLQAAVKTKPKARGSPSKDDSAKGKGAGGKPTPAAHQGKPSSSSSVASKTAKPGAGAGKTSSAKPPGGPSSASASPAKRAPSGKTKATRTVSGRDVSKGASSKDGSKVGGSSRDGSTERQRPPSEPPKSGVEAEQAKLEAEVRARVAALLEGRPDPMGVDFSVEDDEELPTDLTDVEVAELLRLEEERKPSKLLDQELLRSVCCPRLPGQGQPDSSGDSSTSGSSSNLNWLTHVRLDNQRIAAVQSGAFDGMPRLVNLYLQRNRLPAVPDLTGVSTLRFLTLSRNRIEQITGLRDLPNLMFLDVSHNKIRGIDTGELPPSLRFLEIDGNPCAEGAAGDDLVIELMAVMPMLKTVDGMEVSSSERDAAKQAFFGAAVEVNLEEKEGDDEGNDDDDEEDGEEKAAEEEEEGEEENGAEEEKAEAGTGGRAGDEEAPGVTEGGADKLTGVVSYLEGIEKQQLRELYDLSTASVRESLTNLTVLKHRITEQISRPRSRGGPLPLPPPPPPSDGTPRQQQGTASGLGIRGAPGQPSSGTDLLPGDEKERELHDLARELGQSVQQIMNPANDPSALTKDILDGVRESLRSQTNQMMDAARQRLDEERQHDRELSQAIKGIRASQAEKLQLGPGRRSVSRGSSSGAPSAAAAGARSQSSGSGDGSIVGAAAAGPITAAAAAGGGAPQASSAGVSGVPPRPGSASSRRPGTPSREALATERLVLRGGAPTPAAAVAAPSRDEDEGRAEDNSGGGGSSAE